MKIFSKDGIMKKLQVNKYRIAWSPELFTDGKSVVYNGLVLIHIYTDKWRISGLNYENM